VPEAPFAVDPDAVAAATATALRRGASVVWAPGVLRYVFAVLRLVPGPIWRRLDR
jgi:decaprenylphospho-beta-D-erythro-pentofuranosid-2-ulose 2-reductase